MSTGPGNASHGDLGVPSSVLRNLECELGYRVLTKVTCGTSESTLEGLLLERSAKLHADRQQGGDATTAGGVLYIKCLGACCERRPLELHSLGGCIFSGNAFEAHAGRSYRKKWRETIRVLPQGVSLKAWLSSVGGEFAAVESAQKSSPQSKEELVEAALAAVAAAAAALAGDDGASSAASGGQRFDSVHLSSLGMLDRLTSQGSQAGAPSFLLGSGTVGPLPPLSKPLSPAWSPALDGGSGSGVVELLPAAARQGSLQSLLQRQQAVAGRRADAAPGTAAACSDIEAIDGVSLDSGSDARAAAATISLLRQLVEQTQQQQQQQARFPAPPPDSGPPPGSQLQQAAAMRQPAGCSAQPALQAGEPWQQLLLTGAGSGGRLPAGGSAATQERQLPVRQLAGEDVEAVLLWLVQRVQQLTEQVAGQQRIIEAQAGALQQLEVRQDAAARAREGVEQAQEPLSAKAAAQGAGSEALASQLLTPPSGSGSLAIAVQQQPARELGGDASAPASAAVAGGLSQDLGLFLQLQRLVALVGQGPAADSGKGPSSSLTAPSQSLVEGPGSAQLHAIGPRAGSPHTAAGQPPRSGEPAAAAAPRKRPREPGAGDMFDVGSRGCMFH